VEYCSIAWSANAWDRAGRALTRGLLSACAAAADAASVLRGVA